MVLTDTHRNSVPDQIVTATLLLAVLLITLVVLLVGTRLTKLVGTTGASVISRMMGIVPATVAVAAVPGGLQALGVMRLSSGGPLWVENEPRTAGIGRSADIDEDCPDGMCRDPTRAIDLLRPRGSVSSTYIPNRRSPDDSRRTEPPDRPRPSLGQPDGDGRDRARRGWW
ncbi:MarC family protein [uncultured Jannaschia sp.]|uniref:MarC family protein n=1 Tax=uncultured Jannaschia sp. TaxID=293347 RepID=UPI00342A33D4